MPETVSFSGSMQSRAFSGTVSRHPDQISDLVHFQAQCPEQCLLQSPAAVQRTAYPSGTGNGLQEAVRFRPQALCFRASPAGRTAQSLISYIGALLPVPAVLTGHRKQAFAVLRDPRACNKAVHGIAPLFRAARIGDKAPIRIPFTDGRESGHRNKAYPGRGSRGTGPASAEAPVPGGSLRPGHARRSCRS